jgi:hypothetical protein
MALEGRHVHWNMNQSLVTADAESIALCDEINATLEKLALLWARRSSLHVDALALDMRRALAAYGIPGGYQSRDLPARPLRFIRATEGEQRRTPAKRLAA